MKKSKIIVPALAVLCLSTAAAVSGTVAWFSAGREQSIDVSSTVINPEGKLEAKVEGVTAMTKVSDTVITQEEKTALRDGSVDLATNPTGFTAYGAILGSDGFPTSYKVVTKSNTSKITPKDKTDEYTVYYFAEFTVSLKVPGAASTTEYDLFFDQAGSKVKTTDNNNVQNGYRVGMYTAKSTQPCVWAPAKIAAGKASYVNSTESKKKNIGTDEEPNMVADLPEYTLASGKVTNADKSDARGDNKFLGTVKGDAALTINCVVWYEGTDASVNETNLKHLETSIATYTMNFHAIDVADYLAE